MAGRAVGRAPQGCCSPVLGESERRLMAAVLRTVFDDCRCASLRHGVGHRVPSRADARRARAYVASTDRDWPYSFENLCEALGLDLRRMRLALHLDGHPDRRDATCTIRRSSTPTT